MGDYPDYTDVMMIIGSEIMVPIDVQGAYIMMPVDIQAQYVTLDIDIVAQTVGNIAVDLVAQTMGDITVDIKAQTIGNLTIDIEHQSVGVYTQPEWAVLQELEKTLACYNLSRAWGQGETIEYTPSGKDFYIKSVSFLIFAAGSGDYDHFLYGAVAVSVEDGSGIYIGGLGGNAIRLDDPLACPDGKKVTCQISNQSNVTCSVYLCVSGYEV